MCIPRGGGATKTITKLFGQVLQRLHPRLQHCPRTAPCFRSIENDSMMECQLPRQGALSGEVLHHSFVTVDRLLKQHGPVVFKIGVTHDPCFRWRNGLYGYIHERQQWQRMIILFASYEPVGPAFLEASLIYHYQGRSLPKRSFVLFHLWSWFPVRGVEGCRNERQGGESISDTKGEPPFFTYVVYQSFKRPSNAHLIRSAGA